MKHYITCCLSALFLAGCAHTVPNESYELQLVADNQHCLQHSDPMVRKFIAPSLGLYLAKPSEVPANAAYHRCMQEKGW
ncbi:hypothetical protein [Zobellella sp. DQSA1]|uniref:hypothetical protein n=1 Tax=Zobellella sp. DQSA1 TaxID=3342386 RepID=UPI0035BF5DFC